LIEGLVVEELLHFDHLEEVVVVDLELRILMGLEGQMELKGQMVVLLLMGEVVEEVELILLVVVEVVASV
jgi:hypothetical protein